MLPVSYATRSRLDRRSLLETQRSPGYRGRGFGPAGGGGGALGRATSLLALLGVLLLCFEAYKLAASISSPLATSLTPPTTSTAPAIPAARRHAARRQLDVITRAPARKTFPAPHLENLVLVACHSVYTGLDFSHNIEDDSSWFLLDYQKVPGQTLSFLEHIKLGVSQAAADPRAMLLFSGGKTRRAAGPRAEAMGYWLVAEANSGLDMAVQYEIVRLRKNTPENSYENLLFGLCRFFELTGRYPASVAVVGYDFKRDRFAELHRSAVRWPRRRFSYVGTPALTEGAEAGEAATAAAFEADPYGCEPALAEKRATRDPFNDGGYAAERCPGMAALLAHCGPGVFEGALPWDALEVESGGAGGRANPETDKRTGGGSSRGGLH